MIVLVACQLTAVTGHILPWSPGEISPLRVTQSKTFLDEPHRFKETFAVDRNLLTQSVAEVVDGEVWVKVEFGKSRFVHKIVIYQIFYNADFYPDNWCTVTMSNYRACKDNNNNVDVSVYLEEEHQKSCGTLQLTYGLKFSAQIYTFFCDVEGDSIRLSKKSKQMSIYEVVVTSLQGES